MGKSLTTACLGLIDAKEPSKTVRRSARSWKDSLEKLLTSLTSKSEIRSPMKLINLDNTFESSRQYSPTMNQSLPTVRSI